MSGHAPWIDPAYRVRGRASPPQTLSNLILIDLTFANLKNFNSLICAYCSARPILIRCWGSGESSSSTWFSIAITADTIAQRDSISDCLLLRALRRSGLNPLRTYQNET